MTLDEFKLSCTNHKPNPETGRQIEELRSWAKSFGTAIYRECPDSRERAIAITKLEETVMWAVKSAVIPRQESLL